jgi:hypothetical protein
MANRATAAKTREVLVVHEGGAQADAEESPTKGLALFAGEDGITGIALYRLEPIEEGTIATIPPESDEETIRRRFGGGIYRITAKGLDGKIKGSRTLTIGGDPKFESRDAARRYKNKMAGLDEPAAAAPVPAAAPPGMAIPEILTLVSQSHAQQMEMMRLQMQEQRTINEERERRARLEADERESRARREAEESRERDRQFNATMLTLLKNDAKTASSSPLEMVTVLMQGLKLGRSMSNSGGEEGPADPVSLLIQNLPSIIEHGRGLIAAGGQTAQANPGAPQGGIRLTGAVAAKLQATVEGLKGKGYSEQDAWELAERALATGVDLLAQVPNRPTTADELPPPEATPHSTRPPSPPARKATRPRSRATSKR